MPWTQLNVHQNFLGLTDRDLTDFMVVSAIISIVLPFVSGFFGDKIGNFKTLLSVLIGVLGVCTISLAFVPSTNPNGLQCKIIDSICSQNEMGIISENCTKGNTIYKTDLNNSEFINVEKNITIKNIDQLISDCHFSYLTSYWIYLIVRSLFTLFAAICYTLFDGAVLSMAKENQLQYGLQRAWGTLGALISSILGGYIVDFYSSYQETKDFTLMFYCAGCSFFVAALFTFRLDIAYRKPSLCLTKELVKGFCRIEVLALTIVVLLKGIFMTYTETFMYQYLAKMGLSHTLLGATVAVGASIEIVLQILSGNIFNKIGIRTIIPIGILCYSARFLGFNLIYDPKLSLVLETLDAWASGLTDTAMYVYSTSLFPESTVATVRGIVGSLHSGIGKLISAKVGIEIIELYGIRMSWMVMAIVAFFSGFVYILFLIIFKRFRSNKINLTNE